MRRLFGCETCSCWRKCGGNNKGRGGRELEYEQKARTWRGVEERLSLLIPARIGGSSVRLVRSFPYVGTIYPQHSNSAADIKILHLAITEGRPPAKGSSSGQAYSQPCWTESDRPAHLYMCNNSCPSSTQIAVFKQSLHAIEESIFPCM